MQQTQAGILENEARAAVIDRAKSQLELEKQRIGQLLSMLSDFSTQAALLAGCAIAAVSGESLDSLDDEHQSWHSVGSKVFIATGAVALTSSLWVIFISSHLSSLTRDSALRPKITKARKILEEGVHDVRLMQWVALASLLVSSTAMVFLNTSSNNSTIFAAVLFVAVWQATLKKDGITATFREECGDEWTSGDTAPSHFLWRFCEPWRRSCLVRPLRLCRCGARPPAAMT